MESIIFEYPNMNLLPIQFLILELFRTGEVNEWTQQELADFFGVSRETICKHINLLEKRGFIERVTVGKRSVYLMKYDK